MANNPYVNKVVFGSATLVDLTGTTATADKILSGYGAFGADGAWMDGTYSLDFDELTATPTESIQVFTPYGDTINYTIPYVSSSSASNPMVGTVDLSFLTYGNLYKVTGVLYVESHYKNSSGFDRLEFDTLWTASEDGEIEFSLTTAGDFNAHPTKVTLSTTQIKIYYPNGTTISRGSIGAGNVNTRYLVFSEKLCDAFSQVTVNAIPSQYIVPTGTKTITVNGAGIDVTSYASVNVNVSGGSTPTLQTKSVSYTPAESQQTATVTADSGYDGLSSVGITVNAISSTYVGTGITRRSSSDLTASGATVTVPSGYYSAQASKAVTSGTAGTPTATKGSVSNHQVSVTPSVTNTTGYIAGSTKTGTAVTVSASELVSGNLPITQNGNNIDCTNYSTVSVNVPSGSSKNAQVVQGTTRTTSSTLTAIGAEMTVSKTGTYDVYWSAFRSSTSGSYTFGSQLFIDNTAYGSENTTWSNHIQNNHLQNVSLTANQKIRVRGRNSRGSSYYLYAPTLVIIEA